MPHTLDASEAVHLEHAALVAEYGRAQARCSALLAQQSDELQRLQATVVRLRAEVMLRDTRLAALRDRHAALEASIPGLPRRASLVRHVDSLVARMQQLLRDRRAHAVRPAPAAADDRSGAVPAIPADLRAKAVLCVGQDASGTTAAQRAVEQAGGQFLHHDGGDGEGDDGGALEASLVAADLVICQAGCVSHGAYWRVQDHCRRTGKQCVLVDEPQAIRIVRSTRMQTVAGQVGPVDEPIANVASAAATADADAETVSNAPGQRFS